MQPGAHCVLRAGIAPALRAQRPPMVAAWTTRARARGGQSRFDFRQSVRLALKDPFAKVPVANVLAGSFPKLGIGLSSKTETVRQAVTEASADGSE
jgi:hypothetical protein